VCPQELQVAVFLPNTSVVGGALVRTLKVIEHSRRANLRYTAYLSPEVNKSREVDGRLQDLHREGKLELVQLRTRRAKAMDAPYDLLVVPSEFWIQPLNRARFAGISAPPLVELHALPFIGSLDVLKSVGRESPTRRDLVKLPLLSTRVFGDSAAVAAFQSLACLVSTRALGRLRDAKVMAVTPVVSKQLSSIGFPGTPFVPPVHVGVEDGPIHEANEDETEPLYDAVFVGRFHSRRGLLDLPVVVAHLKKILGREVNVAVCGGPQQPAHFERFQRLVRALNVGSNLTMLGFLSSPRDLYSVVRRARVLLYPSYADSFSITVLEALCLGVSVVAYDIDALRMIWGGRKGVHRVPIGDVRALATETARILSTSDSDEVREDLRRQSSALLEEYAWDRVVRWERAFYEWDGNGGSVEVPFEGGA